MTTPDSAFLRTIVEDLTSLGPIQQRPYFGGVALVHDGNQFAFVMGSTLYLATNDDTRHVLRDQGGQPFEYMTRTGPRTVEAYYTPPPNALAHPDELLSIAQAAIATRTTRPKPEMRVATHKRTRES
jgi:DNA transformation protein